MPAIELQHPVEIGGEIVSSIAVGSATRGDFAKIYAMNASAAAKSGRMLSCITGRSWRDLAAIEAQNPGTLEALAATVDYEGA